jgi:hypothetical protein
MEDVHQCLESVVRNLSGLKYECIVVSNSVYHIEELEKHRVALGDTANLISSGGNLGYAGGVNFALQNAYGEYVYILNPDCRLLDGRVVDLMLAMDVDSDWVISGPKVLDETGVRQPSCRRFPRPWTFLMVRSLLSRLPWSEREKKRYLMTDLLNDDVRPVDWVSGGALLIKRAALSSIGGMDERYFLYMEDVDWCRHAWQSGYKVVYWPLSCVVHAGQHKSIQPGLHVLLDRHFRWHLMSMTKYFLKFRGRSFPAADVYSRSNTSG